MHADSWCEGTSQEHSMLPGAGTVVYGAVALHTHLEPPVTTAVTGSTNGPATAGSALRGSASRMPPLHRHTGTTREQRQPAHTGCTSTMQPGDRASTGKAAAGAGITGQTGFIEMRQPTSKTLQDPASGRFIGCGADSASFSRSQIAC